MISGAQYHLVDTYFVWFWVSNTGKTKVTDLEVTGGDEEEVGRLEVPVENIGEVDVFETSENLVEEIANVVIVESLGLEELVEVFLQETLDNVDILESIDGGGPEDVPDVDDVLVLDPVQDLNLSKCPLAVSLMLERADLLDGHLGLTDTVHGRHHHPVGPLPYVLEVGVARPHIEDLPSDN